MHGARRTALLLAADSRRCAGNRSLPIGWPLAAASSVVTWALQCSRGWGGLVLTVSVELQHLNL